MDTLPTRMLLEKARAAKLGTSARRPAVASDSRRLAPAPARASPAQAAAARRSRLRAARCAAAATLGGCGGSSAEQRRATLSSAAQTGTCQRKRRSTSAGDLTAAGARMEMKTEPAAAWGRELGATPLRGRAHGEEGDGHRRVALAAGEPVRGQARDVVQEERLAHRAQHLAPVEQRKGRVRRPGQHAGGVRQHRARQLAAVAPDAGGAQARALRGPQREQRARRAVDVPHLRGLRRRTAARARGRRTLDSEFMRCRPTAKRTSPMAYTGACEGSLSASCDGLAPPARAMMFQSCALMKQADAKMASCRKREGLRATASSSSSSSPSSSSLSDARPPRPSGLGKRPMKRARSGPGGGGRVCTALLPTSQRGARIRSENHAAADRVQK